MAAHQLLRMDYPCWMASIREDSNATGVYPPPLLERLLNQLDDYDDNDDEKDGAIAIDGEVSVPLGTVTISQTPDSSVGLVARGNGGVVVVSSIPSAVSRDPSSSLSPNHHRCRRYHRWILHECADYLVINKPPDLRMDGPYAATVYKLFTFCYPPASWLEQIRHHFQSQPKPSPPPDVAQWQPLERADDVPPEHSLPPPPPLSGCRSGEERLCHRPGPHRTMLLQMIQHYVHVSGATAVGAPLLVNHHAIETSILPTTETGADSITTSTSTTINRTTTFVLPTLVPTTPPPLFRPCHQLDYATSGVLWIARHAAAAEHARWAFEHRHCRKAYLAVVHGHVRGCQLDDHNQHIGSNEPSTTASRPWPVIPSRHRMQQIWQQTEHEYRRARALARRQQQKMAKMAPPPSAPDSDPSLSLYNAAAPPTFPGYQPASSLFQTWLAQQRRRSTRQLKGNSLASTEIFNIQTHTKRPKCCHGNKTKALTESDWDKVWEALESSLQYETTHTHVGTSRPDDDDGTHECADDRAATWTSWKIVKQTPRIRTAFEQAAVVYNRIAHQHHLCHFESRLHPIHHAAIQTSSDVHKTGPNNPHGTLPTYFRVQDDDVNVMYVAVPLAQMNDNFAMRIPPGRVPPWSVDETVIDVDVERFPYLLPEGDEYLDYKPCLTRITVLNHATYQGQPVTKVRFEPFSGRRHQLRVHCAFLQHAILGDQTYQGRIRGTSSTTTSMEANVNSLPSSKVRMCLHSYSLTVPQRLLGVQNGIDSDETVPTKTFMADDPFHISTNSQVSSLSIQII